MAILKPLGHQQLTSLATAASLTVPDGAQRALMVSQSKDVRWRDDGTSPTTTVGMLILTTADTPFEYLGDLSTFKVIEVDTSAKLDVSYYA